MKNIRNIKLGCAVVLSCLLTISEPVLALKRTRQASSQNTYRSAHSMRKRSAHGPALGQDRYADDRFDSEYAVTGKVNVFDQYGSTVSGARIEVSYPKHEWKWR